MDARNILQVGPSSAGADPGQRGEHVLDRLAASGIRPIGVELAREVAAAKAKAKG